MLIPMAVCITVKSRSLLFASRSPNFLYSKSASQEERRNTRHRQGGGVWLRALFSLSPLYVLCLALTSDFTLKKVVKSRTEYMFAWLRAVVLQLVQNLLEFLIDTMSSDVIARKLQGVYDCIDARNFKGAIKLCQRKDIQNYDITKALMSYCFISMQRTEEGLVIAREIKV